MANERRRGKSHDPGSFPDQPRYQRIASELAGQIRRGELPVGSLVPSERQICERYDVSGITARRALLQLTQQRLIYRQVGIGSFVTNPSRQKRLALVFAGFDMKLWESAAGSMGELVGGVSEVAWRNDCMLNFVRIDHPLDAAMVDRFISDGSCDGILLRTAHDVQEEHVAQLEKVGFPYVLIRRHLGRRPANCVIPDDQAGVRLAVAHLVAQGHGAIGYIGPAPSTVLQRDRLRIYRAALAAHDLAVVDEWIGLGDTYGVESGYRHAVRLLSRESRPTAVLVGAAMAPGVYQAATDLRLRIPQDVTVTGYGDVPEVRSLVPPLTRVRFSYYETGKLAAASLLDLILGRSQAPLRLVIEPTLEVGGSSGPVGDRREYVNDQRSEARGLSS
jgi:LacI family transcriptional regulator